VFNQHLIRPEEEPEEGEEVEEHSATFLDATRKFMHQSDTTNNIILMRNKAENELYRLTAHGENTQMTDWLKKLCN
jgi:hypothetical protein